MCLSQCFEKESPILYKILTAEEWNDFLQKGCFEGSKMDRQDKFIHLSFEHQYPTTIKKFYQGVSSIVLVQVNQDLLPEDDLKIEVNKIGGEKYPHLYSSLPIKAVISHTVLDLSPERIALAP